MIVKIKSKKNQKFNPFFALLRMYLSFLVVKSHCYSRKNRFQNIFILEFFIKSRFHVPIFYIMSFYFCSNIFTSRSIGKIKQRFERILIPYLIWPLVIYILNNYIYHYRKKITFYELTQQLLFGAPLIPTFWFQINLIIATFLIVIFELLFKKFSFLFLLDLLIISFYFQYNNYNYYLFYNFSYYKKYSFGRFAEILPYCISGFIVSYLKISLFINKYFNCSHLLFIYIVFSFKYTIFNNHVKGFMYQGLQLYFKSLFIFNVVLLIPLDIISYSKFIKAIKFITNYTAIVYTLHIIIFQYAKKYFSLVRNRTLYGCMIVYLICYTIGLFGILIFGKTKLKYLFQ